MKKITYLINSELEVFENPTKELLSKKDNFMLIESTFIKNSNGHGKYQYFANEIKDQKEQNETKVLEYKGILFETDFKERWKSNPKIGANHHSVCITSKVTDIRGITLSLDFNQSSLNNFTHLRFKEFFNYINDLSSFGTHEAMKEIFKKNAEIEYLKKKLSILK